VTTDEPVDEVPHEDDGLDLARQVSRATAASGSPAARRRRRPGSAPRERDRGPVRDGWSGPHPDERDPQRLGGEVDRLVSQRGWGLDLRVRGVFARWSELVGQEVADHCRPEAFVDGVLTVRTDSTAWATQLKLLAPTVVRRLNDELGDGTVTVVQVQGPHGPTWKRGPRSVRDGRGPRDTYG
jgi:predicted nucleic acid-binding Zn ribbon protein